MMMCAVLPSSPYRDCVDLVGGWQADRCAKEARCGRRHNQAFTHKTGTDRNGIPADYEAKLFVGRD